MRAAAAGADPDLPLLRRLAAHRFTNAQLVAIDVVTVALIAVIFGFLIPHRAPRASGTVWDAGGWVTYAVAAVATPFRRRFPRATLTLVLPVALAALYLRAGGGAVVYVAMALYSVVAVSSRRAALIIVGLVASAVLAATIIGGGDQVITGAIAGVAVVLLGWLAGENTRPAGCTPPSRPSGPRSRRRPPRRSEPSRSGGRLPMSGRRSPGSCTTSWRTP